MTQDDIIRMARENCPYTKELLRGAYYDGFVKAATLIAAPVRTKDLTDDEIAHSFGAMRSFGIEGYLTATREQIILRVRSVLSAFKAKNDALSNTKDLTVSEIQETWNKETNLKITTREIDFARAVIAADREKNNV